MSTRRPRPVCPPGLPGPVALLAMTLAACGDDAGSPVVRTDSAGIAIVRHTGPDRPAALRLTEVARLGGAAEPGESDFADVHDGLVAADGSGGLVVLDAAAHRVLVYGPDGSLLRTFGRQGGGPGELRMPMGLTVADDGTIGVFDIGARGLVRFAPDGAPLPVLAVPPTFFGGRIHLSASELTLPVEVLAEEGGERGTALVTVVHGAGAASDTTRIAFLPSPPMRAIELPSCGMQFSGMPPVFAPTLRWAAGAGTIVAALAAGYELRWLRDGRELARVRRDVPAERATEAMAIAEQDGGMRVMAAGGVRVCEAAEVVRERGFAAVVPAIRRVAVGPDGTVWVERGGVRGVATPTDLFAPDGDYLGTLPPGSPFPVAFPQPDRIAAVERDELGIASLVVYQITRGRAPAD